MTALLDRVPKSSQSMMELSTSGQLHSLSAWRERLWSMAWRVESDPLVCMQSYFRIVIGKKAASFSLLRQVVSWPPRPVVAIFNDLGDGGTPCASLEIGIDG